MTKREARPGYWFLPKAYGYGAVPANAMGWAATLAYLVAIGLTVVGISDDGGKIIAGTCVTVGYLTVIATRTDGGLRWRWGDRA